MNRVLIYDFKEREMVRAWELKVENHFECQLLNRFYDVERPDIIRGEMSIDRVGDSPHVTVGADMKVLSMGTGLLVVVERCLSWDVAAMVYHAFNERARNVARGNNIEYPIEVIDLRPGCFSVCLWLRFLADRVFMSFEDYEAYLSELP